MKSSTELTDLPAEILVNILLFCSGSDIVNTSSAFWQHPRLESVAANSRLWQHQTIGPDNLRGFTRFLGPHTKSLTLRGFVKLTASGKPSRSSLAASEQLSVSVVESVRRRCGGLVALTLLECALDVTRHSFSLFPRTLTSLHLDSCLLLHLPQGAPPTAITSSPFLNISKHLPLLHSLTFSHPFSVRPQDSLAILAGCRVRPLLEVVGDRHTYTFPREGGLMGRGERREASRLFQHLLAHHYTKKSYNTRAEPPQ